MCVCLDNQSFMMGKCLESNSLQHQHHPAKNPAQHVHESLPKGAPFIQVPPSYKYSLFPQVSPPHTGAPLPFGPPPSHWSCVRTAPHSYLPCSVNKQGQKQELSLVLISSQSALIDFFFLLPQK